MWFITAMDDSAEKRWFQFTTRGIFGATFWTATSCFALVLWSRLWHDESPLALPGLLLLACWLVVSIVMSVGALFGRTLAGAVLAVIVYSLLVGWILLAITLWAFR